MLPYIAWRYVISYIRGIDKSRSLLIDHIFNSEDHVGATALRIVSMNHDRGKGPYSLRRGSLS